MKPQAVPVTSTHLEKTDRLYIVRGKGQTQAKRSLVGLKRVNKRAPATATCIDYSEMDANIPYSMRLTHCLNVRDGHFTIRQTHGAPAKYRVFKDQSKGKRGGVTTICSFSLLDLKQKKVHWKGQRKCCAQLQGNEMQKRLKHVEQWSIIWRPALMWLLPWEIIFYLSSSVNMSVNLAKLEQHLATRSYVEG